MRGRGGKSLCTGWFYKRDGLVRGLRVEGIYYKTEQRESVSHLRAGGPSPLLVLHQGLSRNQQTHRAGVR